MEISLEISFSADDSVSGWKDVSQQIGADRVGEPMKILTALHTQLQWYWSDSDPPSRFPRECGTGGASARVLMVNGRSSPCSPKILLPADAEDAVRALVDECCPELRAHVAAWLACIAFATRHPRVWLGIRDEPEEPTSRGFAGPGNQHWDECPAARSQENTAELFATEPAA